MTTTKAPDIVMEQRADVKQILAIPFVREMCSRGESAGLHINMIGPIYVSQDKTQNNTQQGLLASPEEAPEGPFLLRGVSTGVEIEDRVLKRFEPIYKKLPEPKLDATVRLVVETAHRQTGGSPKEVAKALDCSVFKARNLMAKFGLSS